MCHDHSFTLVTIEQDYALERGVNCKVQVFSGERIRQNVEQK